MFVGQPGIWSLPRQLVWAQGAYSWFRRSHSGQINFAARRPGTEIGNSSKDNCRPNDGGIQAWLRDWRGRSNGQDQQQRLKFSIIDTTSPRSGYTAILEVPSLPQNQRGGAPTIGRSLSHFVVCAFALLALLHMRDARPGEVRAAYDYARNLFVRGKMAESWNAAQESYQRFHLLNPEWAAKFQLLEAQIVLRRGAPADALRI